MPGLDSIFWTLSMPAPMPNPTLFCALVLVLPCPCPWSKVRLSTSLSPHIMLFLELIVRLNVRHVDRGWQGKLLQQSANWLEPCQSTRLQRQHGFLMACCACCTDPVLVRGLDRARMPTEKIPALFQPRLASLRLAARRGSRGSSLASVDRNSRVAAHLGSQRRGRWTGCQGIIGGQWMAERAQVWIGWWISRWAHRMTACGCSYPPSMLERLPLPFLWPSTFLL